MNNPASMYVPLRTKSGSPSPRDVNETRGSINAQSMGRPMSMGTRKGTFLPAHSRGKVAGPFLKQSIVLSPKGSVASDVVSKSHNRQTNSLPFDPLVQANKLRGSLKPSTMHDLGLSNQAQSAKAGTLPTRPLTHQQKRAFGFSKPISSTGPGGGTIAV